ncbi:helix-turn-helix domain-containing protein [Streptomyces sp. CB03911]|uniref:helix-turn-helix domain-containing protein n=1 Tax=Streptomyces sp. CB03911 TaxID=1804758 RepID=UPI00093E4BE0|nr:helix-turn-helix domain-containing protein [Streptomyces sp. CB03911]OKI19267.1 hypothetical protein A6A07_07135 [Streptomyces sp. CB03911]
MSISVDPTVIAAAQGRDSDAVWQVVSAFEPMIVGIIDVATKGTASREEREDLMQEGRAALIQRIFSFDMESPASLVTHAYKPILEAVRTAIVSMRPGLSTAPSVELRVRRALAASAGDVETAWQLVNEGRTAQYRMARDTFDSVLHAMLPADRLDAPLDLGSESGAATLADTLVSADGMADDYARREYARAEVAVALAGILPRRALVLRGSYGVGMRKMEDGELGAHLGNVSEGRIRGIRREGLAQARSVLSAAA